MIDRYGNLIRTPEYGNWREHLRELQDAFPPDDDTPLIPAWKVNGRRYRESQRHTFHQAEANNIVPRPTGYVPFQSMYEPDGRHAYDPRGRQYPQTVTAETNWGLRTETPLERSQAYELVRPDSGWVVPNVPFELHVEGIHNAPGYLSDRQLMPPPPRPDQSIYRSMTGQYGTGPGGYQGQPQQGGMGAQPDPWAEFRSAR
jgi:hypothetical protein